MKQLIKPLEISLESSKPILIIGNEIENDALQGMVVNKTKANLKVCAIKSPGFGNTRQEMLQDLAILTKGKVINTTEEIENFKEEDLGSCDKVIVRRNSSLFVSKQTDDEEIQQRLLSLKQQIDQAGLDENEYKMLKYRYRQLSGGISILRIGASTEAEMIERRDRVDDALHATRAAIQEGIVPGGGVALVCASRNIKSSKPENKSGYAIVKEACLSPLAQIVKNTGKSSDLAIEKILENNNDAYGYNAREDTFGDMYEMGVIDPLKVVRCALQNAASASTLLLTSECAMVQDVENN